MDQWQELDLDYACYIGGDTYTRKHWVRLFCRLLHINDDPQKGIVPQLLSVRLWRREAKYVVLFRCEDLRVSAYVPLWSKCVSVGNIFHPCETARPCTGKVSRHGAIDPPSWSVVYGQRPRGNPLILHEEDQMELDLMCLYVIDIVHRQPDPRKLGWRLDEKYTFIPGTESTPSTPRTPRKPAHPK